MISSKAYRFVCLAVLLSEIFLHFHSVLWASPQGIEDHQRVDAYGDPLPAGAELRLGTIRFHQQGHSRSSVAYSRNGELLASTDEIAVNVWNAETGERVQRVELEPDANGRVIQIDEIAFSPVRDELAGKCSDITIRIWDSTTGEELSSFSYDDNVPQRIPRFGMEKGFAFSPDGNRFGVIRNRRGLIYDRQSGERLGTLGQEGDGTQLGLAWSPDGKQLALGGNDPPVRLWEIATAKLTRQLNVDIRAFSMSQCFSPDGQFVAAGCIQFGRDEIFLGIWQAATGELKWKLESRDPVSVHFSPDGETVIAATERGKIHLWDVQTGERLKTIEPGAWITRSAAVTPDGRFIALGNVYAAVGQWNLQTGEPRHLQFVGHSAEIKAVAYSPDGRLIATGGSNKELRIWDAETGRHLQKVSVPFSCYSVEFNPQGSKLAASGRSSGTILVWDVRPDPISPIDESGQILRGKGNRIRTMTFSEDGQRLVSMEALSLSNPTRPQADFLSIWDLEAVKIRQRHEFTPAVTESIAILPDHQTVVTGLAYDEGGNALQIYHQISGERNPVLNGQAVSASTIASSNGILATGGRDKLVRLWETTNWKKIAEFEGHQDRISCIEFSPDGSRIASCDESGSIRLWDVQSHRQISEICQANGIECLSLDFSPDGTRIVTAHGDGTALVWKVE